MLQCHWSVNWSHDLVRHVRLEVLISKYAVGSDDIEQAEGEGQITVSLRRDMSLISEVFLSGRPVSLKDQAVEPLLQTSGSGFLAGEEKERFITLVRGERGGIPRGARGRPSS